MESLSLSNLNAIKMINLRFKTILRLSFLLFLGIMLSYCSSGKNDLDSNRSQRLDDTTLVKEAFINYRNLIEVTLVNDSNIPGNGVTYSTFLNTDKAAVDSSGIVLSLDNNRLLRFSDKLSSDDETSNEHYEYMGFEKKSELYWIKKQLYDEEKHILISRRNGEISYIWSEPIINSQSNYIVSLQNSCFRTFDDCPTGFQIWKVTEGNVSLLLQITLKNYYTANAIWITDSNFMLDIINTKPSLEEVGQDENKTMKYLIRIK